MRVAVDRVVVSGRSRLDLGDIDGLARSISEVGLLQPILIDSEANLVAGLRRLIAVKRLGWREVEATVGDRLEDIDRALQAEHDENVCRKDFTPGEAHAIYAKRKELIAVEAKERQREAARRGGSVSPSQGSNQGKEPYKSPRPSAGESAHLAAEGTGYSAATMRRVDVVKRAMDSPDPVVAEAAANLSKQLDEGTVSVKAAAETIESLQSGEPAPTPKPVARNGKRLPRTDPNKAFQRSMQTLVGLVSGLEKLPKDFALDDEKAGAADADLTRAIRTLSRLRKQIKENR